MFSSCFGISCLLMFEWMWNALIFFGPTFFYIGYFFQFLGVIRKWYLQLLLFRKVAKICIITAKLDKSQYNQASYHSKHILSRMDHFFVKSPTSLFLRISKQGQNLVLDLGKETFSRRMIFWFLIDAWKLALFLCSHPNIAAPTNPPCQQTSAFGQLHPPTFELT